MPGRTLPTLTKAEVEKHSSDKSCYVTIGANVYDVTEFLDSHPGGPELILEYAGKDITEILKDEISHTHSDSAYEMIDEFLVGFVVQEKLKPNGKVQNEIVDSQINEKVNQYVHPRTGMSCEEDLSKDTDATSDYKTHKFLDLNKPLLMQVWRGGFSKEFYLDQVHRPRHYKGGASAPLFGNFLEPLSLTPWWVVPMIWVPPVCYGTYLTSQGLGSLTTAMWWLGGFGLWSLIEYVMHRFLFHLDDYLPDHPAALTVHFLLHGIHHYLPMDKYRLVMPPTLFVALATPFWKLAHTLFFWDWNVAVAVYCGGVFGYICYDLTHYFLHHQNLPLWYKGLKKYHLAHHFLDYELGFGVTSRFWDQIFGTELPTAIKTK
ncbi:inositolphosphorylceramide-B C-26 hydroxylase [Microdochium trichocladiopsis]|uniref:Ceramide very long chain fatty acid hydroxylase n=1 Tax=Microdochium trichocladiopsis TaxID=1682393 RepID=A0A9P8XXK1_9PEZI|nr:inositolphosphorylceramide-B C-26 hydroxylase [Microdochium trichocladiopsis]KAH7021242.1 inositolphosphorylceramide-B C-26 hydroxylase [Microdochium trichocladiopsis]